MDQDNSTSVMVEALLGRREGIRGELATLDATRARLAKEQGVINQHLNLLGVATGAAVRVPRSGGNQSQENFEEAVRVINAAARPLTRGEVFEQGNYTLDRKSIGYTLERLCEDGRISRAQLDDSSRYYYSPAHTAAVEPPALAGDMRTGAMQDAA